MFHVCGDHVLFIRFTVRGHVRGFHLLALVTRAVANVL